ETPMIRKIPQKVRDWLRLLFFLGCLLVYTKINLHEYTIYYYIHSAKTDKSQTPAIVIRYLNTVTEPKREQNGKFYYTNDGSNGIQYEETQTTSMLFSEGERKLDYMRYSFSISNNNTESTYYLDENLKVRRKYVSSNDELTEKKKVMVGDQKIVDQGIQTLIQPILKERVHPPIFFNLQWLYDW
ncbi:hypothetical protein D822_09505, partial [Streptococcus ratti FA-1 = DSM 20564]